VMGLVAGEQMPYPIPTCRKFQLRQSSATGPYSTRFNVANLMCLYDNVLALFLAVI